MRWILLSNSLAWSVAFLPWCSLCPSLSCYYILSHIRSPIVCHFGPVFPIRAHHSTFYGLWSVSGQYCLTSHCCFLFYPTSWSICSLSGHMLAVSQYFVAIVLCFLFMPALTSC